MDRSSKKRICSVVLVLVFVMLNTVIFTGCKESAIPSKIISKDDISQTYTDNSEKFQIIAEFLRNTEEDVYVEKLEDDGFSAKISDNGKIKLFEVTDEEVKSAIEYILNKLNYKYVREDGKNGIYFIRQTSLRFAQGIAYSKDNNEPDWGTIEELEQISGNWYYYKGY